MFMASSIVAESCSPFEASFGPPPPASPDVAASADARVRIPIPGSAESLNVASAASICLYQTARAHRTG